MDTHGGTPQSRDYTHDDAGRLTSVSDGVTTTESYAHDDASRRISALGTTPAFNPGDQLTSDGACSFVYDPEGRRSTMQCGTSTPTADTVYTWDALDRLQTVLQPDGTLWTYTYDALDRRVKVSWANAGSTPTTASRAFQYDDKLVVATYRPDSGSGWLVDTTYLVGPGFGEVLAREVLGGGVEWALRDHLQTPFACVGFGHGVPPMDLITHRRPARATIPAWNPPPWTPPSKPIGSSAPRGGAWGPPVDWRSR